MPVEADAMGNTRVKTVAWGIKKQSASYGWGSRIPVTARRMRSTRGFDESFLYLSISWQPGLPRLAKFRSLEI